MEEEDVDRQNERVQVSSEEYGVVPFDVSALESIEVEAAEMCFERYMDLTNVEINEEIFNSEGTWLEQMMDEPDMTERNGAREQFSELEKMLQSYENQEDLEVKEDNVNFGDKWLLQMQEEPSEGPSESVCISIVECADKTPATPEIEESVSKLNSSPEDICYGLFMGSSENSIASSGQLGASTSTDTAELNLLDSLEDGLFENWSLTEDERSFGKACMFQSIRPFESALNCTDEAITAAAGEKGEGAILKDNTGACNEVRGDAGSVEVKLSPHKQSSSVEKDVSKSRKRKSPHRKRSFSLEIPLENKEAPRKNSVSAESSKESEGKAAFSCKTCDKSFCTLNELEIHKAVHPGKAREYPFPCSSCKRAFKTNAYLLVHMRVHLGVKPFECDECGKTFRVSSKLSRHMRTHKGERPYKCLECGRSFTEPHHLADHTRTHSGERPFKCKECGKGFRQSSTLNSHLRFHSDERPFKCTKCERGFFQSSDLNLHMKSHNRQRTTVCTCCGKRFTHSITRLRHMHLKHGGPRPA